MHQRLFLRKKAFTLVEVTIAIGIAAFGIISMIGLVSSFLNSGRESGEETVLVSMLKKVSGDLRARPFDPPSAGKDDSLATLAVTPQRFYFNVDGTEAAGAGAAYYTCLVTAKADGTFTNATTTLQNRYDAELKFTWPQRPDGRIFQISLARYAH